MSERIQKVRSFIVENFLFGADGGLDDHTSFLEQGIIDSTGILELVLFLEETFHIRVPDRDVVPENLDTLAAVDSFLGRMVA